MGGPLRRVVGLVVLLALAGSGAFTWTRLHHLARTRYFSVDEYQFGHAAWLVSQGRVPYVDFYEHHFPASYVLHAPLVAGTAPFPDRALRLRSAAFVWLLLVSAGLGAATWTVLRDPFAALLAAQLPPAFGFSALTELDFRADNLAAAAWIGCLLLLETNRESRATGRAVAAGTLLALAVLSTQKLVLMGVAPIAALLAVDAWRRRREPEAPAFVARPVAFCATAGAWLLAALVVAVALGMAAQGFEDTIRDAFAHEENYPSVSLGGYVAPFLAETAVSSAAILVFALAGIASRSSRLYLLPLLAALAAGLWLRGRFPYNFVVPCLIGCLLAVRGYAWAVRSLAARLRGAAALAPLLYLLPIVAVVDQLGFTEGRTSNAHQLHVLAKIERFTKPSDVVIDDAGGALFRDHASYYYYHGPAQRALFADYFENRLLADYRASRAPLWIRDFRFAHLPDPVRRYLHQHYVRADGWLYALGQATPATGGAPLERTLDVVRRGVYRVYPAPGGIVSPTGQAGDVTIDGARVGPEGLRLSEGAHDLRVGPGSPPVVVSPLPRAIFLDRFPRMRPYAMLFEYARRPTRAWRTRTVLTP